MAGHLERLIDEVIANRRASGYRDYSISCSPEGKNSRSLEDFNDTAFFYPVNKSIVDLFEEQVARTPDAVAVAAGERELTYRELNVRANRLAHRLLAKGHGTTGNRGADVRPR